MFKYLILFLGLLECILGIIISLKKELIVIGTIIENMNLIIKDFDVDNIKDKKLFSTWMGDIILVQGAIYTFLGAASLYFKMNNLIVVFFIIIIEIIFFNILITGFKNFNK